MKIHQLKPGQIVYDCHSHRVGNTTLRTLGVWPVRIESIAEDGRTVMASWNYNPARRFFEHDIARLTAKEPDLVSYGFGQHRRKTRAEKASEADSVSDDGKGMAAPGKQKP